MSGELDLTKPPRAGSVRPPPVRLPRLGLTVLTATMTVAAAGCGGSDDADVPTASPATLAETESPVELLGPAAFDAVVAAGSGTTSADAGFDGRTSVQANASHRPPARASTPPSPLESLALLLGTDERDDVVDLAVVESGRSRLQGSDSGTGASLPSNDLTRFDLEHRCRESTRRPVLTRNQTDTMTRRADGELETDVLRALWTLDRPASPADVIDEMDTDLAYTSIATILGRLCDKGLASRQRSGRAYEYVAMSSEADLTAQRLRTILDGVSDRSSALAGFAQALAPDEAAQLAALLNDSK